MLGKIKVLIMKSLRISFLILAIAFYGSAAVANGTASRNANGSDGCASGRCVNDNCQSCCDHGNTLWGTPGKIKVCEWKDKQGIFNDADGVCSDSRASTLNATMHKWIKGGEDESTKRCWKVACADDGAYFVGDVTAKTVDTTKCLPCEGTLVKKIEVGTRPGATDADIDGNSQLTFYITDR